MKSSARNVTLTIGEATARFDLAPHVLRHWESMGLVRPRRLGDRRRYDDGDLYRIAMVVAGKKAGLALEDIRDMYAAPDGASRKEVMRQQREALVRRIAEAQAALDIVDHALGCDREDFTQCPNFRSGVAALIGPGPEAPTNSPTVEL